MSNISIRKAKSSEFETVRQFYHGLIDHLEGNPYGAGWQKDIYPAPEFLSQSIENGELYICHLDEGIAGVMVVNHEWNESYDEFNWPRMLQKEEVLVIHALGVDGPFTGKGCGKAMVEYVIEQAKREGMKAIRLDVLEGNLPAEKLYTGCGFAYLGTLPMFYEDTGWTNYMLYEYGIAGE